MFIMSIIYNDSWQQLFDKYDINLKLLDNTKYFPPKELIFKVFELDVTEIRIVLLGQDPYHNNNMANGLSFSVPDNVKIPPSLCNIYKELIKEYPERNYNFISGNLDKWFYREKIFLLNCSLTVEFNKPTSHVKIWRDFTDNVIKFISKNNSKCVFLLLGNFAKSKNKFILNKERIVNGIHPSPLSAHNGFFNSNIFRLTEEKLGETIDWSN